MKQEISSRLGSQSTFITDCENNLNYYHKRLSQSLSCLEKIYKDPSVNQYRGHLTDFDIEARTNGRVHSVFQVCLKCVES